MVGREGIGQRGFFQIGIVMEEKQPPAMGFTSTLGARVRRADGWMLNHLWIPVAVLVLTVALAWVLQHVS